MKKKSNSGPFFGLRIGLRAESGWPKWPSGFGFRVSGPARGHLYLIPPTPFPFDPFSPLVLPALDLHAGHPAHLVALSHVVRDPHPRHLEEGARVAARVGAQPGSVLLQLQPHVGAEDVQGVNGVVEGEDVEDVLAGDLAWN